MHVDFITSIMNFLSAIILLTVAVMAGLKSIKSSKINYSKSQLGSVDIKESIILFLFSISILLRFFWDVNIELIIKGILMSVFVIFFIMKKDQIGRIEILILMLMVSIVSISLVSFLYDDAIKGIIENQKDIIEVQKEMISMQYKMTRLLTK